MTMVTEIKEGQIFNGTPHTIVLYNEQDTISDGRKLFIKEGAQPIKQIESQGTLTATKQNSELPEWVQGIGFDVPLKGAVKFTKVDPLPPGYDIYVVSNLYRSAMKELGYDTSRIATVCDAVYQDPDNPKPIGCLSLAVG